MTMKITAWVFGVLMAVLLRLVLKIGRANALSGKRGVPNQIVALFISLPMLLLIFGPMLAVLYVVRGHTPEFKLGILAFAMTPIAAYFIYFLVRFPIPDMIRMDKSMRNR
jgi:hypothetical protein